ncbi:MAG: N-succinylarginine dihydrolase [Rubripirellula sp.]|nr:N-succinylarginine dihydrolase [Rubripirellula sp.]
MGYGEMTVIEAQIDRIVGPTHHFGGLGVGNVASQLHAGQPSNPRAAAIQGLDKMRQVASLGVPQWILPPQPRPDFGFLRSLGFSGSRSDLLQFVMHDSPLLLSAATSCSAMWTANAATVTASTDTEGNLPVMTVANLSASLHRSIESSQTLLELRSLFRGVFDVRAALPGGALMRDEGAANHMRLSGLDGGSGLNVFVYGDGSPEPQCYWPRQTLAACQAIARGHVLEAQNAFYLKQHPDAIDKGAFHNDVVAMSHQNLLIHHEWAFAPESDGEILRLQQRFKNVTGSPLQTLCVKSHELTLEDAITTYLFNSQIVSCFVSGQPVRTVLCPIQVQQHQEANAIVERWCDQGVFDAVHFVDLGQSMDGGGGPACLRLRVPCREDELGRLPVSAAWTESLDADLRDIISERYCCKLTLMDLADIEFCEQALETQAILAKRLGQQAVLK